MNYNPVGRVVLIIVIIFCIVFLISPWKQIFVYPRKSTRGKFGVLRSIIWLLGLVMTILRSFDIQRIDGSKPMQLPKNHVVFLLDGSLSMSADDVQPSRFHRATEVISQIASSVSGTEYSLIVFSGIPVVRLPRTSDAVGVMHIMSGLRLGDFPATDTFLGTALGDGLLLSLQQFQQLPAKENRSIVVISDGDSNKGYDPYKVMGILQQENIPVYFVAIGEEGYEVGKDSLGLPVITSFDNELMQEFAEQTKGEVYRNPNEEAIRQLSDIISTDENSNAVSYIPNKVALNEYIQAPLLLIFLFILIANLYEFGVFMKRK